MSLNCISAKTATFHDFIMLFLYYYWKIAKFTKSDFLKIKEYVTKYPTEFVASSTNTLWCLICCKTVNHTKKYNIDKHRLSNKHVENMNEIKQEITVKLHASLFYKNVVSTFIEADIPLFKLSNSKLRQLFSSFGHNLPSVSYAYSLIEQLANEKINGIKELIFNEDVFVIAEESTSEERKYFIVMLDLLKEPNKMYLASCKPLEKAPTSEVVAQLLDETFKLYDITRNSVKLLISDAAPYMVRSFILLKAFYPTLNHVRCLSYLLHNCCIKLINYYQTIDQVIAIVKTATIKNKTKRDEFARLGGLPQPILTRWGS